MIEIDPNKLLTINHQLRRENDRLKDLLDHTQRQLIEVERELTRRMKLSEKKCI